MADKPITETTETTDQTTEPTNQTGTLLSDSDGTGQPSGQPTDQPAETVLTQQVSPVKADGSFIDGWKDRLPEELRNEECLNLVNDFPEMVRQFVNQRKAIGKPKVALPNEKSDESEWNSFYEAIGRPKTETGYKDPDIPEEFSEIYNESALTEAKKFAYSIGATQKQYESYIKFEMARAQALMEADDEAQLKAARQAKADAEKTLRTEFGTAFAERMHIANRLITEALPKESERLEFIEHYGNDVSIIRLLSNVGARMSEHSALIAELTEKTPTQVEQQIKKLESDPRYRNLNSDMTQDERQRVSNELRELYKKLHPARTG